MSARQWFSRVILISVVIFAWSSLDVDAARKKTKSDAQDKKEDATSEKTTQPATVYKGPRKRIAVMDFTDSTSGRYYGLGSGMAEMLTTALHETGRFIVVERQAVQDVLTEQNFGMT